MGIYRVTLSCARGQFFGRNKALLTVTGNPCLTPLDIYVSVGPMIPTDALQLGEKKTTLTDHNVSDIYTWAIVSSSSVCPSMRILRQKKNYHVCFPFPKLSVIFQNPGMYFNLVI